MKNKSECKDSTFRVKKRTFSDIFFHNIAVFLHSFYGYADDSKYDSKRNSFLYYWN